MNFKNKKAGEKYLSIWWFLILAIIGAGIIGGTLVFYSKDLDTRKIEADILANRILGCIVEQGRINENLLNEEGFDIFSECNLDKSIILEKGVFFVKVSIDDKEKFRYGANFEKDCNIRESILSAAKYPKCSEKNIRVVDKNAKEIKLKIIAGSNYLGGSLYD